MVLSEYDIRSIVASHPRSSSKSLSVYLNIDQGNGSNLNRRFEAALAGLLKRAAPRDPAEAADFEADATAVRDFVKGTKTKARTLAVFSNRREGFFRTVGLAVSMPSESVWGEGLYVQPMLEIVNEHKRYGVVLTDRQQARFFRGVQQTIEEVMATADRSVRKVKAPDADHRRSEQPYQRHADLHASWHLKDALERVEAWIRDGEIDDWILAGTPEATAEVKNRMSKALRERLAGVASLALGASKDEVHERARTIQEAADRRREESLVAHLIDRGHQGRAALGAAGVWKALTERRVARILYSENPPVGALICDRCGMSATDDGKKRCVHCGGATVRTVDFLRRMTEAAIQGGTEIEPVRGGARDRLNEVGAFGAFLRY